MFKRSLLAIMAIVLTAPVLGVGSIAIAQANPESQGNTLRTANDPTNTQMAQTQATETAPTDEKTERDARVKKMRETLKLTLGAAEKKKIQANCKAAQGKVASVSGRINGIQTSRVQVHQNLVNSLVSLVEKLQAKGADVTELTASLQTLVTKMETFDADLATYEQSVGDLEALDCVASPEDFKAALQTSRTNLEKVRAGAKDIHTYLKDTVKPLLQTIRTQLTSTTTTQEGAGDGSSTPLNVEGGAQ